jgi:hypothetical protein
LHIQKCRFRESTLTTPASECRACINGLALWTALAMFTQRCTWLPHRHCRFFSCALYLIINRYSPRMGWVSRAFGILFCSFINIPIRSDWVEP